MEPETFMSLDEMVIAFKGRHSAKVYMPKKQQNGGVNFGAGQEFQGIFMILKWWELKILKAPLLP